MPPDTRYTGAYRLDDGTFVYIAPREDRQLRFKRMDGTTGTLWPTGHDEFEGGAGWAEREPVVNRLRFEMDGSGRPTGFAWIQGDSAPRHAQAVRFREQLSTFQSGELQLRAKLVLPEGTGPFPAVVIVHGSGSESAVDCRYDDRAYRFPAKEVLLLPAVNVTMELLARIFWSRLAESFAPRPLAHLAVEIEETDGQSARVDGPLERG